MSDENTGAGRMRSKVEIMVSRTEARSIETDGAFGVSMETGICIQRPIGPDRYGFYGIIGLSLEEAKMVRDRLDDVLREFER